MIVLIFSYKTISLYTDIKMRCLMKVSQIMQSNPVCVLVNESLTNIAKQMKTGNFGAVIVKEGDKPLGIVTDRDIVIRALSNGSNISDIKAEDVMTKKIITCNSNDSIQNAANKMKTEKIRRLVVMDDQKKMVGILSLGDIAVSESGKETGAVFEALEKISEH